MFTPCTVIHWRDYLGAEQGKYIFILGLSRDDDIIGFTVSTRGHWRTSPAHAASMVEIPANSTRFLPLQSYIMCFFKPERFTEAELRQAVQDKEVESLGCLSRKYLYKIQMAVQNEILEDEYIQEVMMVLAKAITFSQD